MHVDHGKPRASSLFRLVKLKGQEAFTGWSKQIRAGNNDQPPSQDDVDSMLAICAEFGEGAFREMVQTEYCSSTATHSSTNTTLAISSSTPPGPVRNGMRNAMANNSGDGAEISQSHQMLPSSLTVQIFKVEDSSGNND